MENAVTLGHPAVISIATGPLAKPVCAQPQGPSQGQTGPPMLHLSASSTVKIPPDELVADMSVIATAPSALPARTQVNNLMAKAKIITGRIDSITATFEDYAVACLDEKPPNWSSRRRS